mgnify:CR=1 FL=1
MPPVMLAVVVLTPLAMVEVVAALRYEGRVRRVILAIKQHHRTDVGAALSRPLAVVVRQSLAAAHRQRTVGAGTIPSRSSSGIPAIDLPLCL